jgi:FlgD Ig-like domain
MFYNNNTGGIASVDPNALANSRSGINFKYNGTFPNAITSEAGLTVSNNYFDDPVYKVNNYYVSVNYYYDKGINPGDPDPIFEDLRTGTLYGTKKNWVGAYGGKQAHTYQSSLLPSSSIFQFTPATSITGQNVWAGNINITSNTTINSAATVTIIPGTIIKFSPNVSLTVNGILTAIGNPSNYITFTSTGGTSAGSWGNIILSGSGASCSIIEYDSIKYGNEVQINNVPNFTISNCSFLNNQIAIHADGSTGSILSNYLSSNSDGHSMWFNNSTISCYYNTVKKTGAGVNTGHGLLFGGGSNGTVWQNDIYNVDWGIAAIWGSSPDFYNPNYYNEQNHDERNNRITSCSYGVMIYKNSYPTIALPIDIYGKNSIHNNSVDISLNTDNYTTSNLNAYEVYWNGGDPNNAIFQVGSNSHLYTSPYSSQDPWSSYPLPKIQTPNNAKYETNKILAKVISNNNSTNNDAIKTDSIFLGMELRHQNKYKEAKDYFISYLLKHPDDQRAYIELYNCADSANTPDIIKYFKALPKEASKEQRLFLSYLYQRAGDIKLAKKVNDDLIKEYPNSPLSVRAGIENIYISLYGEGNFDEAVDIFNNVLNKAALSTSTEISDAEYAIESYARLNKKTIPNFISLKKKFSRALNKPDEYSLLGNYPNPFNPTTTIRYSLPYKSSVELKIYDIMGREIKSFSIPGESQGYQNITWSGTNENGVQVSSGIYLYVIKIKSLENDETFQKSAKLLLLK